MRVYKLLFFLLLSFNASAGPMSGTYYIGTGETYSMITSAVLSLINNGVDGPCEFIIKDGTYDEQMVITHIQGTSASNTIVFKAENAGENNVVVLNSGASKFQNYVIGMQDSVRFMSFEGLTFVSTDDQYARLIGIGSSCSNITLKNNYFKGVVDASAGGDSLALVYVWPSLIGIQNLDFIGNVFAGGAYSIHATSGNQNKHFLFSKNEFSFYAKDAIYLNGVSDIQIEENGFESVQGTGLNLIGNDSLVLINKNKFNFTGSIGATAIKIMSQVTNHGVGAVVCNNIIKLDQGTAISVINSIGVKVYHNTVYSVNNSVYYSLSINNSDTIDVRNNLLHNNGTFEVVSLSASTDGITINNNSYYCTGAYGFNYNFSSVSILSSWQAVTGQDANSVFVLPTYKSLSGLELKCSVSNSLQIGTELSYSYTNEDYNGNQRLVSPFWVGAQELNTPADNPVDISGYVKNGLDTIKNGSLFVYGDTSVIKKELDFLGNADIKADGSYLLQNIPAVPLFIKVVPNAIFYPDYIISYHDSSLRIENSVAINPDDCNGAVRDVIPRKKGTLVFDGDGVIKGKVTLNSSGTSKTYGTDPIPGLDVILDKIPPSKTVAVTQTDINGDYEFTGLPGGIYVVTIDYNGLKTDTLYEVEVTGADTVHTELDYCIDTTTQILGCYPGTVSSKEIIGFSGVISPNPFQNGLLIQGETTIDRIEIYSVSGQLIKVENVNSSTVNIRTEEIKKGIYLLKIYQGSSVTTNRIVK